MRQISIRHPENSGNNYGQFDNDAEKALKSELLY